MTQQEKFDLAAAVSGIIMSQPDLTVPKPPPARMPAPEIEEGLPQPRNAAARIATLEREIGKMNEALNHKDRTIGEMMSASRDRTDQIVALQLEIDKLRHQPLPPPPSLETIVGATLAYACSLADQGIDIRQQIMPAMLDDLKRILKGKEPDRETPAAEKDRLSNDDKLCIQSHRHCWHLKEDGSLHAHVKGMEPKTTVAYFNPQEPSKERPTPATLGILFSAFAPDKEDGQEVTLGTAMVRADAHLDKFHADLKRNLGQ